jgi:hypothetical protein
MMASEMIMSLESGETEIIIPRGEGCDSFGPVRATRNVHRVQ